MAIIFRKLRNQVAVKLFLYFVLGAVLSGCIDNDTSLLFESVRHGDYSAVKHAIEVDQLSALATDDDGMSLLNIAAINGHIQIAEYLIAKGSVINSEDGSRPAPPLAGAIIGNREEMAKVLVESGADPHWKLSDGRNLLIWSLHSDNYSNTHLLLSHGLSFHGPSMRKDIPIPIYVVRRNQTNILELFVEKHGLDVNYKDREGLPLLVHAAAAGRQDNLDYLIAQGADIHFKDIDGLSACDYARRNNRSIRYAGCDL